MTDTYAESYLQDTACRPGAAADKAAANKDYETVGIPPLMSRKTLGILDGGRGGGVDRSWRRQGIKGVDKGGAQYPALLGDDVAMHTAMLQVEINKISYDNFTIFLR